MDSKVVDAEESEDTDDIKDALDKLDNFDFDNMLGEESDYEFVQEVIVCSHDNEVVLDLRGKDCIYNQEHYIGDNSTDILLDNQSTVHMTMNSKFLKNIIKSKQVLQLYPNAGVAKLMYEGVVSRFAN